MKKSDFQYYLFARYSKPLINGNCPIYLRIQHFNTRKDIATKVDCPPNLWDEEFKRIRGAEMYAEQNNRLMQFEDKAKLAILELSQDFDYFSVEEIRDHIQGVRKVKGLSQFLQLRIEELANDREFSPNSVKVYRSTLGHLHQYFNLKLRRSDFPLIRVDYEFISGFSNFMKSNGLGTNTVNKYLKTLKAVINEARKKKIVRTNPFDNYKISAGEYNRTFLTDEELRRIMDYTPEERGVRLAKDFFLFVCFTGFHYSDVKTLREANFIERRNQKWILKPRTKNGKEALVPLLPAAERIILNHLKLPKQNDELLVLFSNQKTNQYLKVLAERCDISKNLTCRVGRHTFATTVTLTNQVPLESVSHMLGHTSIKTTQIYARVVNEKLFSDMNKVRDLY